MMQTQSAGSSGTSTSGSGRDFYRIFYEWPVSIERKGVLITSFGESVPFVDFMLCGSLMLVDRGVPDTAGARRIMLEIDCIKAVKITDPIEMPRFTAMGFQGRVDRRKPAAMPVPAQR
ncbi:MAG: hypothetical protein R3C19_03795 [Planctomycetaceae bacterium]